MSIQLFACIRYGPTRFSDTFDIVLSALRSSYPWRFRTVLFYTNLLASAFGVAGLHRSVLILHATCSMEVEAMGGEEKASRI